MGKKKGGGGSSGGRGGPRREGKKGGKGAGDVKSTPNKSSAPLRVAKDVYDRIKFDSSLRSEMLQLRQVQVIAFKDRFLGIVEKSIAQFEEIEEDIPWHRVYYIEELGDFGRRRVWDRDTKFDRMFNSGLGAEVPKGGFTIFADVPLGTDPDGEEEEASRSVKKAAPRKKGQRSFSPQSAYRFSGEEGRWRHQSDAAVGGGSRCTALSIVTWNVLFDLYNAEVLHTDVRVEAIVEELRSQDVDIAALQEVTPSILAMLLANPFIRERFYISTTSAKFVSPYGQVLLSRFPFAKYVKRERVKLHYVVYTSSLVQAAPVANDFGRNWYHALNGNKSMICGEFLLNGRRLCIPVIHLTSDHRGNAHDKRVVQLELLLELLNSITALENGHCIICGDFNTAREDPPYACLSDRSFKDVWAKVCGDDEGITFDPENNTLADLTSASKIKRRLDRMYMRCCEHAAFKFAEKKCTLIGKEPLPGDYEPRLYPSDHFGLRCDFSCCSADGSPLGENDTIENGTSVMEILLNRPPFRKVVKTTAVVIVPPKRCWNQVQAMRGQHDRYFKQWVPHITLLRGFIERPHFDEAVQVFSHTLSRMRPFRVCMDSFRSFSIRNAQNVYLQPSEDTRPNIIALQATLQAEYPYCTEQSSFDEAGYIPHMSVGQFSSLGEARGFIVEQQGGFSPLEFVVRHIYIMSRLGSEPWTVFERVRLGSALEEDDEEEALTTDVLRANESATTSADDPTADEASTSETPALSTTDDIVVFLNDLARKCLWSQLSEDAFDINLCYAVGSKLLGVDTDTSDLDVVCIAPPSASPLTFFGSLGAELQAPSHRDYVKHVRIINAKVPVLSAVINGTAVDVTTAKFPRGVPLCDPVELSASTIAGFDESSMIALAACHDARGIREALMSIPQPKAVMDQFRAALLLVKKWAHARGVYGGVFGYFNGIALSVMMAVVFKRTTTFEQRELGAVVPRFFEIFSQWDWDNASVDVHHSEGAALERTEETRPLVIMTPSRPSRSIMRCCTVVSAAKIKTELLQAHTITASGFPDVPALHAPDRFFGQYGNYFMVRVENIRQQTELLDVCGRVRSVLPSLLDLLRTLRIPAWIYAHKKCNRNIVRSRGWWGRDLEGGETGGGMAPFVQGDVVVPEFKVRCVPFPHELFDLERPDRRTSEKSVSFFVGLRTISLVEVKRDRGRRGRNRSKGGGGSFNNRGIARVQQLLDNAAGEFREQLRRICEREYPAAHATIERLSDSDLFTRFPQLYASQ